MKKNNRILLVESCELVSKVKVSKKLKESLEVSKGKSGTLIIRNIPVTILDRENQNGRIYSTEVMQAAIEAARPLFETKQLIGSGNEHPEGSFIGPTTAAHVVINAYIKPNVTVTVDGKKEKHNVLFNDWEILNTQEGKNLRALFEAECSIGTSIRGLGSLEGKYVVDYEYLSTDCVGNPSSFTYTRMPVSESVQVELEDREPLSEGFTVSTSSTNVVSDLEKAAVIQSQLDNATYGTIKKTSTKLDSEVDPKTGATTSITTLEADTEDEVESLDQALVMAKNAMLNGLVDVDSITIEKHKDEEPVDGKKEAVDGYVPENEIALAETDDATMTEAKETDPNEGKQFVLKAPNGYVSMEGNALVFKDEPKDALHFIVGKENTGLVHLSEVEKILDTMGVYDIQKYYKRDLGDISASEEEEVIDTTTLEENNNPYEAVTKVTSETGVEKTDVVPVSGRTPEAILAEVANLWLQKSQNGQIEVTVEFHDNTTNTVYVYNPATNTLDPVNVDPNMVSEAADDGIEQDDKTLTMTINPDDEDAVEVEKEFDTKAQADAAKAGMEQGKIDGSIMLNEDEEKTEPTDDTTVERIAAEQPTEIESGWYVGMDGVGIIGPFKSEEEARKGLEDYDEISVEYIDGSAIDKEEPLDEAGAGAAIGTGLGLPFGPLGAAAGGALGSLTQDLLSNKQRKPGWKSGALIGGMVGGLPGALVGGGLQHLLTNKEDVFKNGAQAIKTGATATANGLKATGKAFKNGYNSIMHPENKNAQGVAQNNQVQGQVVTQNPEQNGKTVTLSADDAMQAQPTAPVQNSIGTPLNMPQNQNINQAVNRDAIIQVKNELTNMATRLPQLQTTLQNILNNIQTESTEMDEVLYKGKPEASDPVVNIPLKDSEEDLDLKPVGNNELTITLTDIDWDVDSLADNSGDDLENTINLLPNEIEVMISPEELGDNVTLAKRAILDKANSTAQYKINDARITDIH